MVAIVNLFSTHGFEVAVLCGLAVFVEIAARQMLAMPAEQPARVTPNQHERSAAEIRKRLR
jgi:hypothetical protein